MLAQRVGFLGVKIAVHAGPHNALNYAPILIFCISIASSDQGGRRYRRPIFDIDGGC
jgi:hypothetical protein